MNEFMYNYLKKSRGNCVRQCEAILCHGTLKYRHVLCFNGQKVLTRTSRSCNAGETAAGTCGLRAVRSGRGILTKMSSRDMESRQRKPNEGCHPMRYQLKRSLANEDKGRQSANQYIKNNRVGHPFFSKERSVL